MKMIYLLSFLLAMGSVVAAPADEKVDYLPEMGNFTFGLYSGYLPINNT